MLKPCNCRSTGYSDRDILDITRGFLAMGFLVIREIE